MPRRSIYRVRQFRRAVGAAPSAGQLTVIERYLSPAERRLFGALAPRDQHHSLETLRLLACHHPLTPTLARAALLHDIGKGYIRLHERVIFVLLSAAAPRLLARLTGRERPGLLGALYRTRHHARAGAAMLAASGAEAPVVALVARHHLPPAADAELRALIHADDRA